MKRRDFLKTSSLIIAGSAAASPAFGRIFLNSSFDLLIFNSSIIDGSGRGEFLGDIGIKNGKIIAIRSDNSLKSASADFIIDGKGLKSAPGFVDIHSHTDNELFINPNAESKIRQGVTTENAGNDGGSFAPRKESDGEETDRNWRDFKGFFDAVEKNGTAVNFTSFVGLGTIRAYTIGYEDRQAASEEMKEMKKLVAQALEQGALGISTGLEYTPGSFASTEEIIELSKLLRGTGKIYASHMRNEDKNVLKAIDETIEIGRKADIPIHISHLKTSGRINWNKIEKIFEKIENAKEEGIEISFDRYPYVAYSTGLSNLFPLWSREGGNDQFVERLKNDSLISKIKKYTLAKVNMLGSWNSVLISGVDNEKNQFYEGKTIQQIAEETGEDPFEITKELLIGENGSVSMCGFGMSEENTKRILAHPLCMVSSDGSARASYGKLSEGNPHPRSYGTFPRFLAKYTRNEKIVDLTEAIRKMSQFPAAKLGLHKRGLIQEDYFADLVLFDYEKVEDKATFTDPHQYPDGLPYVIVNGKLTINKEKHTGKLAGRVLTA